jgi:hypothetical protein
MEIERRLCVLESARWERICHNPSCIKFITFYFLIYKTIEILLHLDATLHFIALSNIHKIPPQEHFTAQRVKIIKKRVDNKYCTLRDGAEMGEYHLWLQSLLT